MECRLRSTRPQMSSMTVPCRQALSRATQISAWFSRTWILQWCRTDSLLTSHLKYLSIGVWILSYQRMVIEQAMQLTMPPRISHLPLSESKTTKSKRSIAPMSLLVVDQLRISHSQSPVSKKRKMEWRFPTIRLKGTLSNRQTRKS